uniref:Uncharacterized protein n=1 Tax=viral metagenome TaxID=1070528 RepID=A0A6M3J0F0_9ZZZZ
MIWGQGKSYIVDGVTTITLNKSVTSNTFFENQDKEFRSIINGVRTYYTLSDYADFTVTDYFWLYDDTKFNTLKNIEGNTVIFYLNGQTIISNCLVRQVKPLYFRNNRNYDLCTLIMTPLAYIQISQALLNEDGTPLLNEDGTPLLSEGFSIV